MPAAVNFSDMLEFVYQTLVTAANLVPGMAIELAERKMIRPGGGWIESYHPIVCQRGRRELEALGFEHVGELLWAWMPGWVLRGFSQGAHGVWAVHYVGLLLGSRFDFVSEFQDGTWLTTTSHAFSNPPLPGKRFQKLAGAHPLALWEAHVRACREIESLPTATLGLEGLAACIERYCRSATSPR